MLIIVEMVFFFLLFAAFPFVKEYGCYANPEDSQAFMFSADEKLTCLMGEQVFTQAMVRAEGAE